MLDAGLCLQPAGPWINHQTGWKTQILSNLPAYICGMSALSKRKDLLIFTCPCFHRAVWCSDYSLHHGVPDFPSMPINSHQTRLLYFSRATKRSFDYLEFFFFCMMFMMPGKKKSWSGNVHNWRLFTGKCDLHGEWVSRAAAEWRTCG